MIDWSGAYEPKLKVSIVTPSMKSGGAERHIRTLIRHAHRVQYTAVYCPDELDHVEGVPAFLWGGNDTMLMKECDLIFYWGFEGLDLRKHGKPVVQCAHHSGSAPPELINPIKDTKANFLTAVCTDSVEAFPEHLRRLTRVAVIHNGSDVERVSPRDGREAQRKRLSIPDDAPVILYVGRFYQGKGADVAVEAMRYLPDHTLILLGWGEQADELREAAKHAKGRVIRLQPQTEALGDIYAAADCLVLPSETEAFPLVLIEAWQAGVPVISPRYPSVAEMEDRAGTRLISELPCCDPAILASKILHVQPTRRTEKAKEFARDYLTASRMVGRWESFFAYAQLEWLRAGRHGKYYEWSKRDEGEIPTGPDRENLDLPDRPSNPYGGTGGSGNPYRR